MTGTERLTTFGIRLLDFHIGIAKTNDLLLAVLTGLHNRLLAARNLALGLVAFHLGLVDLCHVYSTNTVIVVFPGMDAYTPFFASMPSPGMYTSSIP